MIPQRLHEVFILCHCSQRLPKPCRFCPPLIRHIGKPASSSQLPAAHWCCLIPSSFSLSPFSPGQLSGISLSIYLRHSSGRVDGRFSTPLHHLSACRISLPAVELVAHTAPILFGHRCFSCFGSGECGRGGGWSHKHKTLRHVPDVPVLSPMALTVSPPRPMINPPDHHERVFERKHCRIRKPYISNTVSDNCQPAVKCKPEDSRISNSCTLNNQCHRRKHQCGQHSKLSARILKSTNQPTNQ